MTTTEKELMREAIADRHRSNPGTELPQDAPAWLGFALIALGVGSGAVSLLGPLVAGVIEYHASDGAINQIIGGDVAALVLVTPVSILAGILILRRHPNGALLGLGPAIYAPYMYTQLAIGNDPGRYAGNSEQFFLLYLGLVVLGLVTLTRSWRLLQHPLVTQVSRGRDRWLAIFLLTVAGFLTFGLHLPGIVDAMTDAPSSPEYLADPVVFWVVKMMDLGFVVPFLVWVGIGLLQHRVTAHRAAFAAVGWAALLGSSVAGMAVVMQATGDPAGSTVNTLAFSIFAATAIGFAVSVYRPLFAPPASRAHDATRAPRSGRHSPAR